MSSMSTMLGESLSLREGRRERRSSGGQTFKISRFSFDLARPRPIFDNQKRHPPGESAGVLNPVITRDRSSWQIIFTPTWVFPLFLICESN
jgi:hypothetical protein